MEWSASEETWRTSTLKDAHGLEVKWYKNVKKMIGISTVNQ